MKNAFRSIRSALGDIWEHLPLAIAYSLTWLVLTVLIIPGPPATLALFDVTERLVRRDHLLGYRDYLRAVRAHFGVGWRWAAICGPVLALLLIDILVAPQMFSPSVAMPLQMFFIGALALWIVINWYALAFLFQQQELSVRQALRNGAILLLQHPLFTLVIALATALLLWLGMILILVNLFFGPILVALIGTHAVLSRLEPIRAARRADMMHDQ
jgi:uncharacterized membrane protein YesL